MNTATMQIANRTIGHCHPVMIVAEIGVNHDGSLLRALQLVEAAATAGADAVKLQVFRAQTLMHGSCKLAAYQEQRVADNDAAAMLRRYELDDRELADVVKEIRRLNMIPVATPFSPEDVARVERLDIDAIKIASPDVVNEVLLERAAEAGRPLLVSTGAATIDEVESAVWLLRRHDALFALIHCISSYPTPGDQAQLGWIGELSVFDVPVGYSDHTTEMLAGGMSVTAGAAVIEKHLTYDRSSAGPDHATSFDPIDFASYVRYVRVAEQMRGNATKRVLDIEQDVRRVSRQSLVLRRDLNAGEKISVDDLTVQRPGTGIPAASVSIAIGQRVRQPLRAGTLLQWDMLCDAA
jgi:N-acetylneuraminate synthase/N,N'-diacetyllegionaminate synthase